MINPKKIWSSSQLPTLPSVALRLLEVSKNPDIEITEIAEIIKTDPAISAKVLKATNSSFFGFTSKVTSVDRAVPLLGTTVVTSLALSFSLVDAAMSDGSLAKHYKAYWLQSVVQAATSELLGETGADGLECEYFLAGLLIDIGRLAMLKTIGQEYLPILEKSVEERRALHEVETELLGFDHVEIGAKLMEHWSLPEVLRTTVELHHASAEEVLEHRVSSDFPLIKASCLAAAIGEYFCGSNRGPALEHLQELAEKLYGFEQPQLEEFLKTARKRMDEAGDMFATNMDDVPDPEDLMAEASDHLSQIAMRQQMQANQAEARQREVEQENSALESKNRELQSQAIRDPLTKLYNRGFFDESLSREVNRCGRTAQPVGVIFSDIDRFKSLNDTYGHQFGDEVLIQVADLIGRSIRSSDVLGRYGGEEFVILVTQPTEAGLQKLAERIRAQVEAAELHHENERVRVTISIGASVAIPKREPGDLAKELVASADAAMYDSKQNGRNQVHFRSMLNDESRRELQQVTKARFSRWMVSKQILQISVLSKVLAQLKSEPLRLGELAESAGCLNAKQIDEIMADQQESGERFGTIAKRMGFLSEEQLVYLLATQQEDPLELSKLVVRMNVIQEADAAAALKGYLTECEPRRAAAAATS